MMTERQQQQQQQQQNQPHLKPPLTEVCDFTQPGKKWAYPFVPKSLVFDTRGSNASFNFKEVMICVLILVVIGILGGGMILANRIKNPRLRVRALMLIVAFALLVWNSKQEVHIFFLMFLAGLPQIMTMRSPPILDIHEVYPYSKEFEKAFPEIKEEVQFFSDHLASAVPFTGEIFTANKGIGNESDTEGEKRERKGWRILLLKLGDVIEENCQKFGLEKVCSLLRDRPEIYNCAISVLDGGKDIPLHQGYYKGFTRLLFPVTVPEPDKTYICINGMEYHWSEGKGLLFDDLFVHEVHNKSDKRRIMLFMDVQRPSTSKVYNKLNKMVLDTALKLQYTKAAFEKAKQDQVEFESLNPVSNFH